MYKLYLRFKLVASIGQFNAKNFLGVIFHKTCNKNSDNNKSMTPFNGISRSNDVPSRKLGC